MWRIKKINMMRQMRKLMPLKKLVPIGSKAIQSLGMEWEPKIKKTLIVVRVVIPRYRPANLVLVQGHQKSGRTLCRDLLSGF